MGGGLSVMDWACVGEALVDRGSVYLRDAVDADLVQLLIDAAQPPWHALPTAEGPVRQHGFASYQVLAEAEPAVRQFGADIVGELTTVASPLPLAVPSFNEVSWKRYPAQTGHITAHRDPAPFDGIIAIATLSGTAAFRVWGGSVLGTPAEVVARGVTPTRWSMAAGDLVLLRGNGWPVPNARCPMHEADAPPNGERMIVTFRHNTRGAGTGYDPEPV
jgi:hypothetical protein